MLSHVTLCWTLVYQCNDIFNIAGLLFCRIATDNNLTNQRQIVKITHVLVFKDSNSAVDVLVVEQPNNQFPVSSVS